jgi:hypothetical protein
MNPPIVCPHKGSRGSSISCEPRFMKRKSQDRIFPPPTLVWTCQKKKKKIVCPNYTSFGYFHNENWNRILSNSFKLYNI